ncbi:MAG: hypothetical protein DRH08_15080, partial [Deltaproteobacteria bacterium]
VLYKQGQFDRAGGIFLSLIDIAEEIYADELKDDPEAENPVHAIIYDHAGDCLYRLGWKNEAKRMWTKALQVAKKEKMQTADLKMVQINTPIKLKDLKSRREPKLADFSAKPKNGTGE